MAVQHRPEAPAGQGLEVLRRGGRPASGGLPPPDHRFAQGVLRAQLRPGQPGVDLFLRHAGGQAAHRRHLGHAAGQGARLVEGRLAHLGQPLQGVPLPHQEAVAGGVADGRHDSGGGGQHQGAGAEHHQDGHRPDHLTAEQPREGCGSEGGDHDPGGPAVGQAHDLRLARIRRLHQADHPLDGAVLPHPGGLHLKGAELVDGAAEYLVSRPLVHREGLAGHHRLVDGGLSGPHHPVHRNGLSGEHPQPVPHRHGLGGDALLPGGGHPPGSSGRQPDQLFDARPGLGHRPLLQQRAKLHDEGDLAGGKDLPNGHRGEQRQGHQHVGLDVKAGEQPHGRLPDNGRAAEQDGQPRRVHRQGRRGKKAQQEGTPSQRKECDIPSHIPIPPIGIFIPPWVLFVKKKAAQTGRISVSSYVRSARWLWRIPQWSGPRLRARCRPGRSG